MSTEPSNGEALGRQQQTGRGSYDAVYNALCTRVRNVRLDLVATYGLERVMQEIEATSISFANVSSLEEIGSSDVSSWMMDIEESLKRSGK